MDEKAKKVTKKKVTKATKKTKKTEKKLTEKEKLFCVIYINNYNAGAAVMKSGYKPKDMNSARVMGYELLNKTYISKEITRLKKEKMKALKLHKDDIVERFMRIAFADMTDFVEWGRVKVPVIGIMGPVMEKDKDSGEEVPMLKEVNELRFKESTDIDGALVCQIKQGKDGASLKLEDRQKALEWLADYFEMNPMNKHKKAYDKQVLAHKEKELEHKFQSTQETQDIIGQMQEQFNSTFEKMKNFAPNRREEDIEND